MMATRNWAVRIVAGAGALFMPIAVVVTANHYIVDVVAGVGLSLLAAFVAAGYLPPARLALPEAADDLSAEEEDTESRRAQDPVP